MSLDLIGSERLIGVAAVTSSGGSGITISTTTITGGADTRVLFVDNGVVGEDAAFTFVKGTGTLAVTILAATAGISGTTGTFSTLTSGRVPFASTAGLLIDNAGFLYSTGVGASITMSDAATTTQTVASTLFHATSGTAAAGFGTTLDFSLESGGGNQYRAGRIGAYLRTATDAGEASGLVFMSGTAGGAPTAGAMLQAGALYGVSSIGVGTLSAGAITNSAIFDINSSMVRHLNALATQGGHTFAGTVNTSGARSFWVDTPSANTGITTLTERITRAWGCSQTSGVPSLTSIVHTWANGTVALQRENVWVAPTYLQTSGTQVMTVGVHHDFGTSPIITGTTNSLTGARIARMGGAAAVGVTAAATTYVGLELVPSTLTYTGATQVTSTVAASQLRLDVVTISNAAATFDTGATLDIVGPVAITGGGTLTTALSMLVRTGTSKFNGLVDLSGIAAGSPNFKVTLTSDTPTTTFSAVNATNAAPVGFVEVQHSGITVGYFPIYA